MQIYIEVNDNDTHLDGSRFDSVDLLLINHNQSVEESRQQYYTGMFGIVTMNITVTVFCQENFEGPDCTQCVSGFTGVDCSVLDRCLLFGVICIVMILIIIDSIIALLLILSAIIVIVIMMWHRRKKEAASRGIASYGRYVQIHSEHKKWRAEN